MSINEADLDKVVDRMHSIMNEAESDAKESFEKRLDEIRAEGSRFYVADMLRVGSEDVIRGYFMIGLATVSGKSPVSRDTRSSLFDAWIAVLNSVYAKRLEQMIQKGTFT